MSTSVTLPTIPRQASPFRPGSSPLKVLGASIPGVAGGLDRVETTMHRLATSSAVSEVNDVALRIVSAGGKRLRSVLALSSALAWGGAITDELVTAAACIELLHAGSLVHDDLLDDAEERRGVRTINAEWGTGHAVMIGDFIIVRASHAAMVSLGQPISDELASAAVDLVDGQFMEMQDAYCLGRTRDNARRSVTLKTGALFRASCAVGARSVGASEAGVARMREFGTKFGVLFQILDDLLDLTGTAETIGKPVGNDLRQGVYTLPLLSVLEDRRLAGVRTVLRERPRGLTDADVAEILAVVRSTDLVERTLAHCRRLAGDAALALPPLASDEIGDILRTLPASYVDWTASVLAHS
jgi:geranylgeranyl pyrophosphate synthase